MTLLSKLLPLTTIVDGIHLRNRYSSFLVEEPPKNHLSTGLSVDAINEEYMKSQQSHKTYKSAYSYLTCATDSNTLYSDKHTPKANQNFDPNSPVSIFYYRDIVRDHQSTGSDGMTPNKCFDFCRSFQNINFFGILNGNDCYCSKLFSRSGGAANTKNSHSGNEECNIPCTGDVTLVDQCGGAAKSSIFEMHQAQEGDVGLTVQDLMTFRQEGNELDNYNLVIERTWDWLKKLVAGIDVTGAKSGNRFSMEQRKIGQNTWQTIDDKKSELKLDTVVSSLYSAFTQLETLKLEEELSEENKKHYEKQEYEKIKLYAHAPEIPQRESENLVNNLRLAAKAVHQNLPLARDLMSLISPSQLEKILAFRNYHLNHGYENIYKLYDRLETSLGFYRSINGDANYNMTFDEVWGAKNKESGVMEERYHPWQPNRIAYHQGGVMSGNHSSVCSGETISGFSVVDGMGECADLCRNGAENCVGFQVYRAPPNGLACLRFSKIEAAMVHDGKNAKSNCRTTPTYSYYNGPFENPISSETPAAGQGPGNGNNEILGISTPVYESCCNAWIQAQCYVTKSDSILYNKLHDEAEHNSQCFANGV